MNALKYILIYALTLCGTALMAEQQTGVLKGIALNIADGEVVPFANIVVKDTAGSVIAGAVSDMNGLFVISPIAEGTYTVEASYIGFSTETYENVEIKNGETNTMSVLFTEQMTMLEECVIVVQAPLISKCCSFRCCYFSYGEPYHQSFQDSISMYPNPSSGELNVQSQSDIDLVTVTNLNGQTVAEIAMDNPTQVTTNLQHLPPATYVVHFVKGGERVSKLWILAH